MAESTRGTRVLQMPDGTITRNYQTQELHVATQSLDLRVPMTSTASSISSTPSFRTPTSSQDPPAATAERESLVEQQSFSHDASVETAAVEASLDRTLSPFSRGQANLQRALDKQEEALAALPPTEARGSKRPR